MKNTLLLGIIFALYVSMLLANPIEKINNWTSQQTKNFETNDVVNFINGNREEGNITFGNEYIFNSANTWGISATTLDTTHFVVTFNNLIYSAAIVGTVSGSTISYSSEYIFNSEDVWYISVTALDATHFVVTYYFNDNDDYRAKVGIVSGSSISYGPEYVFSGYAPAAETSAITLDATHFVIAYFDKEPEHSVEFGAARIGTVSGSDISFSTVFVFDNEEMNYYDAIPYSSATILDATHFIVAYVDDCNSHYGTARVGSVSGNTISFGPEYVFNNWSSYFISTTTLDATHFAVGYRDGENSGNVRIGTVSDSYISFGPEYVFYPANPSCISLTTLDTNRFIVSYDQHQPSAYGLGTSIVGYVSGNTISFGSEYFFYYKYYFYLSSITLETNRFIVVYSANNDYRGSAVVGEIETALSVPTNVIITINGDNVELLWDDIGVSSYNIYRSTNPYTEDWGVAIGSSDVNSYTDEGAATSGNKYFYHITSSD